MRRQILTAILAFLIIAPAAKAVIADPQPHTVVQPDGKKVTVVLHGDEFGHWMTTADGRCVTIERGFVVPAAEAATKAGAEMAMQKRSTFERMLAQQRASSISQGDKHFLVVLVEFADLSFKTINPQTAFSNMLNQQGYSANGSTGSVRDYYVDNSMGVFKPTFDVAGPVKVANGYAFYGGNDANGHDKDPRAAFREACLLLDDTVDFSQYDLDNNGYVDNIFFYFAGYNEAEYGGDDTIWPHAWTFSGSTTLDGKRLGSYACSSELNGSSGTNMASIGSFCHEFGHVLGLPDFYDTDYEQHGSGDGLGAFSLMSNGSYNNGSKTPPYLNAVERNILQWMDVAPEWTDNGPKTVGPVYNNIAFLTPTSADGERFIYETRDGTGWDKYIPSGLLIYHMDKSSRVVGDGKTAKNLWNNSQINIYGDHQCFYIVKSVPGATNKNGYPFPGSIGNTSFTATSNPSNKDWSGKSTGYNITDIKFNGTNTTLTLTIDKQSKVSGKVMNTAGSALSGAKVYLCTETETKAGGPRMLQSSNGPRKTARTTVTTGADGMYEIELPDPAGTKYSLVVDKEGYIGQCSAFVSFEGTNSVNFYLREFTQPTEGELFLFDPDNDDSYVVGSTDDPQTVSVAIEFSAEDISKYVGYTVESITFDCNGTGCEGGGVFVDFGNERKVYKTAAVNIDEVNTIDVLSYGAVIPAGKSVRFGYSLKNVTDGRDGYPHPYPIVTVGDTNDAKGTNLWNTTFMSTSFFGFSYNAYITVKLRKTTTDSLAALGWSTIQNPGNGKYTAGTALVFKLTESPARKPESVRWRFDGADAGESVTLTAGTHTIQAILTYINDEKEILEQQIIVE